LTLAGPLAGAAQGQKDQAPKVAIVHPVARQVVDYETCTGRTEASASVQLRARVSGYLDKIHFKEGEAVKKGDVLFEIDAQPHVAALELAEAKLKRSEAIRDQAEANYKRAAQLILKSAVSKEDFEEAAANRLTTAADVRAARATRDAAKLNLEFTKVKAPISGTIDRPLLDPGNLVKADDTLLATVTVRNPMYVAFDLDERSALRLRRAIHEGKLKARDGQPVAVALADEKDFPRPGKLDFVFANVNPETGAVRLRAVLANDDGRLVPGQFVRVRLATSAPHRALLVPEKSVRFDKDKGQAFLLVVAAGNVIERRPVTLGARHDDLRAVSAGVQLGDRVVRDGTQDLRPGMGVFPVVESAPPQEKNK
jgi:RND family efflux transporter MFP subunit